MPEVRKQGGKLQGSAAVDANSVNAEARTFDVVFATETPVFRSPWWSDESFNEVLAIGPDNIRTARLDTGGLPLLNNHNQWSGIEAQMGRVIDYSIDPAKKEARATIQFSSQERYAGTFQDIKDGIVRNISVGYRVWKYEQQPKGNAQDVKETPVYRAIDWEPLEISLVSVPADPNSSVRAEGDEKHTIEIIKIETQKRSGMNEDLKIQIRQAVTAAGLPESFAEELIGRGVTMDAATTEISARKAQVTPAPAVPATPAAPVANGDDVTRAVEAERDRCLQIRAVVDKAGLKAEFAEELIKRKADGKPLTLDGAKAAVLDRMAEDDVNIAGPGSNASVRRNDERDSMQPLVEALMERSAPGSVLAYNNLKNEDGTAGQFAGRGMSEAARDFRHATMVDMARHLLIQKGERAQSWSADDIVKRAMATTDLPDLFTSVVSRFMRQYYEPVVPEWMQFSQEVPADDFRVKTGIKVDGAVTFEEITENGEYKSAQILSNEKATLQLKTFGRMFQFGRKSIINDDKSVLTTVPRMIALGYRQFQSKKWWAMITDNVTCPDGHALFSAAHNNLAAGAKVSEIVDAALSEGRTKMRRQKSPEGNELSIRPRFLMVPPELETTAQKLLKPITPYRTEDVNLWGSLEPIVNDYFTDTLAWYMVADPKAIASDGAVHAYLSGQKGLYTESYIDPKNDALVLKARGDFDCQMWGHQGWYKNPGKAPSGD